MSRSRGLSVQPGITLVYLVLFTSSATVGLLNLKKGESCGPDKVCMKISECNSLREIGYREKVENCGYEKHLPIVCCTTQVTDRAPSSTPVNKTISEKMCKKYAGYVFVPSPYSRFRKKDMCGTVVEPLIKGGKAAKLREYPHMESAQNSPLESIQKRLCPNDPYNGRTVRRSALGLDNQESENKRFEVQIGYGSPNEIPRDSDAWRCGGSLISERFVISAAHCTYLEVSKRKPVGIRAKAEIGGLARWARMGVLDTRMLDIGSPQTLKIVEWINRTDYTGDGYNDIVLFKLERNVKLDPHVHPICLQVNEYIEETRAIATGWGKLSHGSMRMNTNRLQKVGLNILENKECGKVYNTGPFKEGIRDTQLCAGDAVGHDTCPGDSGGPLQVRLKNPYCMYSLIGITSGGSDKCGSGLPGIYTRVSKYISWIEENVWPNEK